MVEFTEWYEGIILILIFAFAINVPCYFAGVIGKRLIEELGNNPSEAPVIQLRVFWKLIVLESLGFGALFIIYHVFSS